MQRTSRILLRPTPEQASILLETTKQFTTAYNHVCEQGWKYEETNGVYLHHLTYYPLRAQLPNLPSDLICQSRCKATEAVKSSLTKWKRGKKVSCPKSILCPPRLDNKTYKINWTNSSVKISTVSGRQSIPFILPDYYKNKIQGKLCSADLVYKNNRWHLHIVVDTPTPQIIPDNSNEAVIGVDLGLNRPAVTSNNKFLGKRQWRNVHARIFRQRRKCQKKGTRSAKRKLKQLSGKTNRFRRDCDHVLSKKIIAACPVGGVIVLENLKHIRKSTEKKQHNRTKRQRRREHSWSFLQLKVFLGYKAAPKGIRVVTIDPRYTSQTCTSCGFRHKSNRPTQSTFRCRLCGFELNADLNAACCIRLKYLASKGNVSACRLLSTNPKESTSKVRRYSPCSS